MEQAYWIYFDLRRNRNNMVGYLEAANYPIAVTVCHSCVRSHKKGSKVHENWIKVSNGPYANRRIKIIKMVDSSCSLKVNPKFITNKWPTPKGKSRRPRERKKNSWIDPFYICFSLSHSTYHHSLNKTNTKQNDEIKYK